MVLIIPIFLIFLNLILFWPFFHLGLFGDDWVTIVRYSYYLDIPKHLGPYSKEFFNNFNYLFNAYGIQDSLMAFLHKNFGTNSNVYFLLSYLLRVLAGFSIFLPAFYITRSKLASFFAVAFFLFSSAGIETSGWVFNMPSYLTVTFFSLFIYFYLRSHKENSTRYLLFSYLFFFLSFISNLIRSHGLFPFVVFVETYWFVSQGSWKNLKSSFLRIIGFTTIPVFVYFAGFKETISGNSVGGLLTGLHNVETLLSQGRFDFLFYPLTTLGSIFIPEIFLSGVQNINSVSQYFISLFVPTFLFFVFVAFILKQNISELKKTFLKNFIFIEIVWGTLVLLFHHLNITTFSNGQYISLLLIGGSLIITCGLLFINLKAGLLKDGLAFSLGWILISFLYPWWSNTTFIYLTTHRYLLLSSLGMALLLGCIIGLAKDSRSGRILLVLFSIPFLLHGLATKNYILQQYQSHNKDLVNKIWSQMPHIHQVANSQRPLAFFFEGDSTNGDVLHDTITYGFPSHMGLLYGVTDYMKQPVTMDTWDEVVSAVKDGKSFKKHYGIGIDPIPVENVYVFKLEGRDNLVDLTDQSREKLKEIK